MGIVEDGVRHHIALRRFNPTWTRSGFLRNPSCVGSCVSQAPVSKCLL